VERVVLAAVVLLNQVAGPASALALLERDADYREMSTGGVGILELRKVFRAIMLVGDAKMQVLRMPRIRNAVPYCDRKLWVSIGGNLNEDSHWREHAVGSSNGTPMP
jgi:hypothetical protein